MKRSYSGWLALLAMCLVTFGACNRQADRISIVAIPDTTVTNVNYISNRKPLQPSVLIKLPVGSIVPDSWLKVCLERQANGLCGNLGKISAWLQKKDNAWLSKDGKGTWGWEEVPYWLKGFGDNREIQVQALALLHDAGA